MKGKFLATVLTALLCSLGTQALQRIAAPTDPSKRCNDTGVPQAKCEVMRKKALDVGCITKEEFDVLAKYGAYPSCNMFKGEGLEMLDGWCSCGCFHPDTYIGVVFSNGEAGYQKASTVAYNRTRYDLIHLAEEASLSNFSFAQSPISLSTVGDAYKPLIVIRTEDGVTLKITEKHPVLTSKGQMVQASQLRPADQLVTAKARHVRIVSVDREDYEGPVVNFTTESESQKGHVIFANDIAVGDLYWQSGIEDQQNSVFIRK
jgi:hypothetical protein